MEKSPRPPAERALFLSLWAVLILLGLIWRFWPHSEIPTPRPPVEIAAELSPWFSDANVVDTIANHYTVRLKLRDDSPNPASASGDIVVNYRLLGERDVLFEGSTPCRWEANHADTEITLENPRRVAARGILLHLAH